MIIRLGALHLISMAMLVMHHLHPHQFHLLGVL